MAKKRTAEQVLADCDKWDNMYKRLGAYGVTKLMIKTKSWKDYSKKWPFDYTEVWESVTQIDTLALTLPDQKISIEDEINSKFEYEKFIETLTEKQQKVWKGFVSGLNSHEIEATHNFNNNNTVRWYKHKIKNKYLKNKYGYVAEYICKDCAWQWRSKESTCCNRCDSKSILVTRKNIPNIPEDI